VILYVQLAEVALLLFTADILALAPLIMTLPPIVIVRVPVVVAMPLNVAAVIVRLPFTVKSPFGPPFADEYVKLPYTGAL
jgi:hypothetical protein